MKTSLAFYLFIILVSTLGCNSVTESAVGIDDKLSSDIKAILQGNTDDTYLKDSLQNKSTLLSFYEANNNKAVWSSGQKVLAISDTLVGFLKNAKYVGLFKEKYNYDRINERYVFLRNDTLNRSKPNDWLLHDLMLSDAYISILRDLKYGRMADSSINMSSPEQDLQVFKDFFDLGGAGLGITTSLKLVQPAHEDYWKLVNSASSFTDSMDSKRYTPLGFPYKDSTAFVKLLKKRIAESGINVDRKGKTDSIVLAELISKYQQKKGIKKDGKLTASLVKNLNNTDYNKFLKFALTLDKYKTLPSKMPNKYIWVNIPSYRLQVISDDTVALESKVICGKSSSSTPEITSEISDLVLYPTWIVPTSIITAQMIPGLKRNPNYLARRGLYLLDRKGRRVNAASVNWSKYSKGIPYLVQQGSGDDNSLGVIKFNFKNDHSVYLHDTNQRYLFKNTNRSLSHGCVRVEQWRELAHYIANTDSVMSKTPKNLTYSADSIDSWLTVKKMRKIDVKYKMPLFIVYFSVYADAGHLKFYDDVYDEDSRLIAKYYSNKNFSP